MVSDFPVCGQAFLLSRTQPLSLYSTAQLSTFYQAKMVRTNFSVLQNAYTAAELVELTAGKWCYALASLAWRKQAVILNLPQSFKVSFACVDSVEFFSSINWLMLTR